MRPHAKKRVIIIGAGASGIAAAKQLREMGFDIFMLEARVGILHAGI